MTLSLREYSTVVVEQNRGTKRIRANVVRLVSQQYKKSEWPFEDSYRDEKLSEVAEFNYIEKSVSDG